MRTNILHDHIVPITEINYIFSYTKTNNIIYLKDLNKDENMRIIVANKQNKEINKN